MPNNLQELHMLLEQSPEEHRQALANMIEAPFGSNPTTVYAESLHASHKIW
jgi:hypothetical protein